ncbi:BLUF domain-containing protein [Novosphingobium terrae]|uniref:BLUF domain-containing protein n=1 Tax=Novosphingobium terrae TaxID=2726189 RepID=UPI00197F2B09|nr:BLUF domain-containing protein [Novosphingobium terrae]
MQNPLPHHPNLDYWLYASHCALPSAWALKAVEDIVAKSIQRNASLQVTGALLFNGTRFVQFLEGPADGVAAIRQSILADSRHRNVTTFMTEQQSCRIFSNWSLAYVGPSVFISDKIESMVRNIPSAPSEVVSMLRSFVI